MFQPEIKLQFVRRYCNPEQGWVVLVDIDASESGRTGGDRKNEESRLHQRQMQESGQEATELLQDLGVTVGGDRRNWFTEHNFPAIGGRRDVVAFHTGKKLCLIVEVEGDSSGQPEQKLYRAVGQVVAAADCELPQGWGRKLVIVVHGKAISRHLERMRILEKLAISGLALARDPCSDRWLFGGQLPSHPCCP